MQTKRAQMLTKHRSLQMLLKRRVKMQPQQKKLPIALKLKLHA